jgi:branched-chain amino acid transport system ATP-binding protein
MRISERRSMLEVSQLRVSYGPVEAVRGVDLEVPSGSAVGLLGPNAAGKTSTLRAISRLVPYQGTIRFDGEPVGRVRPDELVRRGLLHVPEGRRIFPNLSVHENLLVGTTARHGRPPTFSVDDVYDLFPALTALRGRAGWALSGGEQQMTAVGRALVGSPRLLMLDEPSLGLAPVVVSAVYRALADVKARVPLLLVEQNSAVALHLCDRGYVLAGGKVELTGTAAELGDRTALLASYLGQGDLRAEG